MPYNLNPPESRDFEREPLQKPHAVGAVNPSDKLVYCKDCGSSNTWKRYPARDWKTETGIFEYAYRCSVCGAITLRPEEVKNNG